VKADDLLRSPFIGWAGGAEIGPVGGGGGAGVAYDELDTSQRAAVTYGAFTIGIGVRASTGLLVGAMTRAPRELNASTADFEFGATLAGIGAYVSVVMEERSLDLIGFTLNVGIGGGLDTVTGYGKISAR
jgi:hypothetical protein